MSLQERPESHLQPVSHWTWRGVGGGGWEGKLSGSTGLWVGGGRVKKR